MAHFVLFVTPYVLFASSARTRSHTGRLAISEPSEQLGSKVFEKSKSEKDVLSFAKEEFDDGPFFEQCGADDEPLTQLSQGPLTLSDLGKLAKSGQFFASQNKMWLVKAIKDPEANVLEKTLNTRTSEGFVQWYETCAKFRRSLLSPIVLSLSKRESVDGRPYIVMTNETARFKSLVEPSWDIESVYDMKPLPNLAEDLGDLVESLQRGFLSEGNNVLNKWQGWDDVKAILKRDVDVLSENELVDYSLFIHVFRPRTSGAFMLGADDGCIVEPAQKAAMCFRIIDFLTEYTLKRRIESMVKHAKFHEYSLKMVHAFDCLGDLSASDCTGYVDYKGIVEASVNENRHVFSTLLASETFKEQYQCAVQAPRMVYSASKVIEDTEVVVLQGAREPHIEKGWSWAEEGTLEEVALKDTMFSAVGGSSSASALAAAVSANSGGRVIGSAYEEVVKEQGGRIGLESQQLEECTHGIYQFATYTQWFHQDNTDLNNVLWSPTTGLGSIVVVRKKKFWGSHSDAAARMRKGGCFLRSAVFHCRPKNGKPVVFDYKNSFGDLEVLVVEPSHTSGQDYGIWKDAKRKRLVR